jgi:hypothetical protein
MKRLLAVVLCAVVVAAVCTCSLGKPYTMRLGSKSDPQAHLFAYDQKWRESTYLTNYNMSTTAAKEFTDATHLSTRMELTSMEDWVEILIGANFSGIARIGYVVYDPATKKPKEETSRISHMFIGNFTLDEHLKVVKDHSMELGFLPPV